jgi:hypothetical protein
MPQLFKYSGQTGSPDQQDIDQKKKLAQLIQMMSMQPNQQAIASGSPLVAASAPILQALAAKKVGRNALSEQEALNASRMQDFQNVVQAGQGTPAQAGQPFVDEQAQFMGQPSPEGLKATPDVAAVPGGREAMVRAMLEAKDPQLRMAGLQTMVGKPGDQPSTVQEWNFFNTMNPKDQARFLEMKRNPNIMNLGGEFAVRQPGGGVGERYQVTPKPEQMPAFQGAQERAKATEKAAVGMEEEFAKKGIKAKNMNDLIEEARSNLTNASGGYAGTAVSAVKGAAGVSDKTTQANRKLKLIGGWMVSNVPRMEGPQSNFDVKNYREMAATVGDTTIPIEDRMAALDTLQQLQSKYSGTAPASNIDELLKKY